MQDFINFMNKAKCNYFAVKEIKEILDKENFKELKEKDEWKLENNKNYYCIRHDSSIIAFKYKENIKQLKIVLSHTDSPTFKLKQNFLKQGNDFNSLDLETYGGPIISSWLDRPVSICGRVFYKDNNQVKRAYYDLEHKLIIPNCPPHLKKDINLGYQYQVSKDISPILNAKFDLLADIARKLNTEKENIVSYDLVLYNVNRVELGGVNNELLYGPQIDNLMCAYTTLKGFSDANSDSLLIYGAFDNEEVGSLSTNGAESTFLKDIVDKLLENKNKRQILANSFVISADNAHAINPNHKELFDQLNAPIVNGGVVIKENANLSYTTTAFSKALFKTILDKNNIKYQFYANHSDIRGGSTLGRLSLEQLSIHSVDIGLAQLAMHSSYEVAGIKDLDTMIKAIKAFNEQSFEINDEGFILND